MSTPVRALVLTGYGLNCDHETAHALTLAGAAASRVHINALIDGAEGLEDYQILVCIGGFGWGDDHGGGVIQAVRMKTHLGDSLLRFIDDGKLVLGICNGFQALVNLGLLPGFDGDYTTRSVALTANDCGNFRDQWVGLAINPDSPCVFTREMDYLELPVRHGEGKFYTNDATLARIRENHQLVMQYALPDGKPANGAFPHNPNGSIADIAGICDTTGRVFGLMPHPEAYNHPTAHPDWFLSDEGASNVSGPKPSAVTPGIRIFQNAVNYFM